MSSMASYLACGQRMGGHFEFESAACLAFATFGIDVYILPVTQRLGVLPALPLSTTSCISSSSSVLCSQLSYCALLFEDCYTRLWKLASIDACLYISRIMVDDRDHLNVVDSKCKVQATSGNNHELLHA